MTDSTLRSLRKHHASTRMRLNANDFRGAGLLKSRLATTPGEMESLRPAWDALYRTADYTIFQSFSWNHLAARAFSKNNLCIAYAEGGEEGAALIPAVVEQGGLAFLGDAMFDYRDVLACGEPSALRQAWSQLAGLGLRFSL